MTHAIECNRREIELGEGRFECRRAKGTDICMDCALEMDGPEPEMNADNVNCGEYAYRDSMNDAGRGGLLR